MGVQVNIAARYSKPILDQGLNTLLTAINNYDPSIPHEMGCDKGVIPERPFKIIINDSEGKSPSYDDLRNSIDRLEASVKPTKGKKDAV